MKLTVKEPMHITCTNCERSYNIKLLYAANKDEHDARYCPCCGGLLI